MTIIIIEGVVATGKTALVKALEQCAFWRERPTKVTISEHYTERVLELTAPSVKDRQTLLYEHLAMARTLHARWTGSRFGGNRALAPLMLLERFHLSHAAQVGDFAPFRQCDKELKELGAALVFLHHPPELLLSRVLATVRERHPMWESWLRSLGSHRDIEDFFCGLQQNSMAYYEEVCLPKIRFSAHGISAEQLAQEVLSFVTSVTYAL